MNKLPLKLKEFNLDELMKVTQKFGYGKTKRILKSIIRRTILNE